MMRGPQLHRASTGPVYMKHSSTKPRARDTVLYPKTNRLEVVERSPTSLVAPPSYSVQCHAHAATPATAAYSGSLAVLLHEAVVELLEALDDLVGLLLLHQDGGAEVVRALLLHRVYVKDWFGVKQPKPSPKIMVRKWYVPSSCNTLPSQHPAAAASFKNSCSHI